MTPIQILVLAALCVFAVYRQSRRSEVIGVSRFRPALIYAVVGVVAGGFSVPASLTSWVLLCGGFALSAIIGVARGMLSGVWLEADGKVYSRGTALTIALFILLVGTKFALGALEYVEHVRPSGGGFGEVMLVIALMLALQAEIIWRRATALAVEHATPLFATMATR
jgi:hypothetical protein